MHRSLFIQHYAAVICIRHYNIQVLAESAKVAFVVADHYEEEGLGEWLNAPVGEHSSHLSFVYITDTTVLVK